MGADRLAGAGGQDEDVVVVRVAAQPGCSLRGRSEAASTVPADTGAKYYVVSLSSHHVNTHHVSTPVQCNETINAKYCNVQNTNLRATSLNISLREVSVARGVLDLPPSSLLLLLDVSPPSPLDSPLPPPHPPAPWLALPTTVKALVTAPTTAQASSWAPTPGCSARSTSDLNTGESTSSRRRYSGGFPSCHSSQWD